jgi:predicted NUDIX family NTP pyrophosphohydrolase
MSAKGRKSAGLLLYRARGGVIEVFLVHPGGPFWSRKDVGAWTIPKGEIGAGELPLDAARREVREETGYEPPGPFVELPTIRQKAGKTVMAWAAEFDCDPATLRSNVFSMEWPPRSGRMAEFPEVDRGAWYGLSEAREKILPAQSPFLDAVEAAFKNV